jgi:hypothetical protein
MGWWRNGDHDLNGKMTRTSTARFYIVGAA